jgi:predicted RNA binding protein YcfA (HicA-like mRNA interferase family)
VHKLPRITGAELIAALKRAGFVVVRQRGSHVSLRKDEYRTVVPMHDELAIGTLSDILKQTGISRDDLHRLLKA